MTKWIEKLSRPVETERNRKLLATNRAIDRCTFGLAGCLAVACYRPELGLMLAGLLVPYLTAVGANLALFIQGNVKVHQATGGEPSAAVRP